MPKKDTLLNKFSALSWKDIEKWAGDRIVNRGRKYQLQGRVTDLSETKDNALIAWVQGSKKYTAKVAMNDNGQPESICSCPYEFDCKHGVAVVIEYLKQVESNQPIPKATRDDHRLNLLEDKCQGGASEFENAAPENIQQDIDDYLKSKTKAQLIKLIHDLSDQRPEMARELFHRQQLATGNVETLVARLRQDFQEIGNDSDGDDDWQNDWEDDWNDEESSPDYPKIRKNLKLLLDAGRAEETLSLGRELIDIGRGQIDESYNHDETAMGIADCMPLIVDALDRSSLDCAGKLNWAMDVALDDPFEIFGDFADYLRRSHPKAAWRDLADRLLTRLKMDKSHKKADDSTRDYDRDKLSDWAIHALKRGGRDDEIIPLCVAEARQTNSYDRLVTNLIENQRYKEACDWIQKGIQKTRKEWPGIADKLRENFREIRTLEKDWPSLTALQVEEFTRCPSMQTFIDCKKASEKIKAWPATRRHLLRFLETGQRPWNQKGWSLPESGLKRPDADQHNSFPLIENLIEIAIFEKNPAQALKWHDQRPDKDGFGWGRINEDAVATAVQIHAPDRAVGIWKIKAEQWIAQVKLSAYKEAAKYLAKAARVMDRENKKEEWMRYIQELRKKHARKNRLLEILDALDDKPIIAKQPKDN